MMAMLKVVTLSSPVLRPLITALLPRRKVLKRWVREGHGGEQRNE